MMMKVLALLPLAGAKTLETPAQVEKNWRTKFSGTERCEILEFFLYIDSAK